MTKVTPEIAAQIIKQVIDRVPPKVVAANLNIKLRQVYYHLEKAGITSKKHHVRNARMKPETRPTVSMTQKTYQRLKAIQVLYGITSMSKTLDCLMNMTRTEINQEMHRQQADARVARSSAEISRQLDKVVRHGGSYEVGTSRLTAALRGNQRKQESF